MSSQAWPGDWLRGALEVCVLKVLAEGPTYGYAIAVRLEELGLGVIKGGTLYPLLGRFEEARLVTAQWRAGDGGPGRKYVTLTDAGHAEHVAQASAWADFAALTTHIVAPTESPDRDKEL